MNTETVESSKLMRKDKQILYQNEQMQGQLSWAFNL